MLNAKREFKPILRPPSLHSSSVRAQLLLKAWQMAMIACLLVRGQQLQLEFTRNETS